MSSEMILAVSRAGKKSRTIAIADLIALPPLALAFSDSVALIAAALVVFAFEVVWSNSMFTATIQALIPDQVRSRFICSPWSTGKTAADGVWERFATVSAGTGAKLSNQRGLRKSQYIANFTAEGTIEFDKEFVEPKTLKNAIEWGGKFVGIGASRKMGWGRFELVNFEE